MKIDPLPSPAHAYFIPNLTRAVLHGEIPRVVAVEVVCVSLVREVARIRFAGGGCRWTPWATLCSTSERLTDSLAWIESLAEEIELDRRPASDKWRSRAALKPRTRQKALLAK